MTAVENKIPDLSSLFRKTDYDGKILDIGSKYVTTADYNEFTKGIVDNSIKSKNLVIKTDFDASVKKLIQIKQNI